MGRDGEGDGGRFTVGALLADLGSRSADGQVGADEVAELVAWFTGECRVLVDPVPAEALPLRLPKSRITALLACERGTVARLGPQRDAGLTEPIVRGRLTDMVVAQHVAAGGVADPSVAVHDAVDAWGDHEVGDWLAEASPEARQRVDAHIATALARLEADWGVIDDGWWPRLQERVTVPVADGGLVLSGIFDLSLGGGPTGRPWVVVEVKAGTAGDRNRADVLWYGLLGSLRFGVPPAVVATWTAADGGLVPVEVTIGSLEAAARRGLAALERLADLAGGRDPEEIPNRGCTWCPDLDRCESGLARVSGGTDSGSSELPDEGPWDDGAEPVPSW